MATHRPARVRAVVVNFDRAALTVACVESLQRCDWPSGDLEIVVVDNGSSDGSADTIRARFPEVRLIASEENLGFAGGNDLALRDLDGVDFVALVNNDATVTPNWLGPLVDALDVGGRVGAACPKILFAGRFHPVRVTVLAEPVSGGRVSVEPVPVHPVLVQSVAVDGVDTWGRTQFVAGFGDPALDPVPGRSVADAGVLHVPAIGTRVEIGLSGPAGTRVELASAAGSTTCTLGDTPVTAVLELTGPGVDIVNNVGGTIDANGFAADRGYQEIDEGQYDAAADVFAWCGAAVLFPTEYLRDVGLLDQRLFLYYEDIELAWRGRRRGWRYRYVPTSVVHHVHAATSDQSSERFAFFNERNRLLVLTRHSTPATAARGLSMHLAVSASYLRRGLRTHGDERARALATVGRRNRALGAYLRLAPAMLRERRRDSRARRAPAQ